MRLAERDKRDVWISSEAGAQIYGAPFRVRGVIAPKNSLVRTEQMFVLDEFDLQVTFELDEVMNKGITKTSVFWLYRKTAPGPDTDPPTHKLKGITRTTDDSFAVLVLEGLDGANPLNEV
jgi:hypothetical protein